MTFKITPQKDEQSGLWKSTKEDGVMQLGCRSVKPPMKDPPKSNPSKRHRLRLNGELDHLASLLPFEQNVISKLDKLSILRLAVCYLRTKSYFQSALHERYALTGHHHHLTPHNHHIFSEPGFADTDSVLQALNGFMFTVTCDGEVFFASRTVEQYLGFHQSDIIHQSALELIHSEDREEFKNQLNWRSQIPQDQPDMTLQQIIMPENSHLLQRCFTVRFRCLLDNTSGFITLEISGRIKILTGQCLKPDPTPSEPPLALMALCCPFGPLPLLDVPPRDYTFKSKHKMDMAPLSMDPRGKLLFGFSDQELMEKGGYDLIHPDDLQYYAAAHQELIKTGSSGLIAYRFYTKDFRWIWLQTSSKVIYKNSKPDFVICTHRHLTEDEGRELVGKRGSEFKLPYPIIDNDPSGFGATLEDPDLNPAKTTKKKSKTQLRDYLQAGRKRKTPYRDPIYPGLNGYAGYTGLNGYTGGCQTGEMKPEFMYPYGAAGGNNFPLDAAAATDLYRTGYHTIASTMYPSTADTFRSLSDAEKHSYATANGYYLDSRQYQHTLQYHGNGYTDLMAQSQKYTAAAGYDMSKYATTGYEHMGGYTGLDLSKTRHYDDHDISRYDATPDYRKYADFSATADKLSRVNGTAAFDSLRGSSFYPTSSPGMVSGGSNEGLLACGTSTSPCSRADLTNAERYSAASSNGLLKEATSTSKQTGVITANTDFKQQQQQMSVIRHPSPRNKSPLAGDMNNASASSASLHYGSEGASGLTSWSACSKNSTCKTSPQNASEANTTQSPIPPIATDTSRIVSPAKQEVVSLNSMGSSHSNPSPASATTATSVIQQSGRPRACDKSSPPAPAGIAVPVVRSPPSSSSSWLHHPVPTAPTSTASTGYDWPPPHDVYYHQRAAAAAAAVTGYETAPPKVVCYNEGW